MSLNFPQRSNSFVVGITGYKRHGKDTIANQLINNWGFRKIAFADTLKDVCAIAFNIPRQDFDNDEKKDGPSHLYPEWTLRQIMQTVGTDMFRSNWPNIWIDVWKNKAANNRLIVVPDVRFPNEQMAIETFPYNVLIRVTNPRLEQNQDDHPSEKFIDTLFPHITFINNGTIEQLNEKINRFMMFDVARYNNDRIIPRIYKNQILRSLE